jgi:hemerythrin-like domain-containing protein
LTDVVKLIKTQHQQIDKLLEQAADEGADRAALLRQAADLLIPHSKAEEDFVYPTIKRKASEAGEDVEDGVVEHHSIEGMLQDLLGQDPDAPGWDGLLAALTGELRHHVEEEEQELLPVLQKTSSAEELQQMGQRFADATGAAAAETDGLSRDELYERAREQDIKGRSKMSKDELAQALDE